MNLQFSFNIDEVNLILRQLDAGPHAQVRQLIDKIITATTEQQKPVKAPEAAAEGAQ